MRNRSLLLLVSLLLAGGLLWLPATSSYAQEDHATVEVAETERESPAGPGLIILLVGLGALSLVGLATMARQSSDQNAADQSS